jgi:hypothetical protein
MGKGNFNDMKSVRNPAERVSMPLYPSPTVRGLLILRLRHPFALERVSGVLLEIVSGGDTVSRAIPMFPSRFEIPTPATL